MSAQNKLLHHFNSLPDTWALPLPKEYKYWEFPFKEKSSYLLTRKIFRTIVEKFEANHFSPRSVEKESCFSRGVVVIFIEPPFEGEATEKKDHNFLLSLRTDERFLDAKKYFESFGHLLIIDYLEDRLLKQLHEII